MTTKYEPTPIEKKARQALLIILDEDSPLPSEDHLWYGRQHMPQQTRSFLTFRVLDEQLDIKPVRRVKTGGATEHQTLYRAPVDVQAFGPGADAILRWIVTHSVDAKYTELWADQDMQLRVDRRGVQNITVSTGVDVEPRALLRCVLHATLTENSTSDVLQLMRLNDSTEDIPI